MLQTATDARCWSSWSIWLSDAMKRGTAPSLNSSSLRATSSPTHSSPTHPHACVRIAESLERMSCMRVEMVFPSAAILRLMCAWSIHRLQRVAAAWAEAARPSLEPEGTRCRVTCGITPDLAIMSLTEGSAERLERHATARRERRLLPSLWSSSISTSTPRSPAAVAACLFAFESGRMLVVAIVARKRRSLGVPCCITATMSSISCAGTSATPWFRLAKPDIEKVSKAGVNGWLLEDVVRRGSSRDT
mmetsp:Transcript_10269/g.25374  ORF Transcript_10269/g.25374 Transcript_10269/m.25374 type:complete len:247 (-) Transcript_10269:119-859(-)